MIDAPQKRHRQMRTLALLVFIFLGVFFWPAIKWMAVRTFESRGSVQFEGISITVPSTWMIRSSGRELIGWKPCLTILCSSPSSSFSFRIEPELVGHNRDWEDGAKETLSAEHSSAPTIKDLHLRIGVTRCLEAVRQHGSTIDAFSTCFEPNSGFAAAFEGDPSRLEDFHSVLSTAHR
jgi:hypothetical protein